MLFNYKHDVQMLQQNSYRITRYWRYLSKYDIASTWRLCDIAILFLIFSRLINISGAAIFVAIYCLSKIIFILRQKSKKKLVFTKRVFRIYGVCYAIFAGLFLWAIFILGFRTDTDIYYSGVSITLGIFLLFSFFSWIPVILAVVILMPMEKAISNSFIGDAKRILSSMHDLKVIGITGSYGKTSTKHYLYTILSEKYDVLMTPGSFNTSMGVVRTIREMMKPYYNIFICEMGAKQKGDIKEICDIVHPSIGIVTAVGPMHLETFKNIANVASTKFELIDSLPSDGFAVINNDFDECAKRKVEHVEYARYSARSKELTEEKRFLAKDINYTKFGTTFTVETPDNKEMKFETSLVGECNISNILAAIVTALKLGMSEEEIRRGVAAIEPVEHRLSVKRTPGGVTIIDDAFNSNPEGSKMALEVLEGFREGRRIIVTPGMIELGDRQFELNKELGREIPKHSDIAIIVGEYNREALLEGIKEEEMKKENIYEASSFDEAQKILSGLLQSGDTILYENDLPDTFK